MNWKKITGIILLSWCLHALPLHAQVGEQYHNFSIGINGGVDLSSVMFTPTVNQKNLMGINGGVSLRYISEKYFRMICGAMLEINFAQRGWSEYYQDYPSIGYERTMNYIEVPFLAHLAFGKDRGVQFFIHAGPQIAFFMGDSYTQTGNWGNIIEQTSIEVEQHDKPVDNKFDYGIAAGAGFEIRTAIGNFLAEGRYYYGLSDFYNSTKKDYFSRSAHGVITAKITYLFDLTK